MSEHAINNLQLSERGSTCCRIREKPSREIIPFRTVFYLENEESVVTMPCFNAVVAMSFIVNRRRVGASKSLGEMPTLLLRPNTGPSNWRHDRRRGGGLLRHRRILRVTRQIAFDLAQ